MQILVLDNLPGDGVKPGLWTGPWTGLWTGISWTHFRLIFKLLQARAWTRSNVGARNNTGEPTAAAGRPPRKLCITIGTASYKLLSKSLGAGTIAPKHIAPDMLAM